MLKYKRALVMKKLSMAIILCSCNVSEISAWAWDPGPGLGFMDSGVGGPSHKLRSVRIVYCQLEGKPNKWEQEV